MRHRRVLLLLFIMIMGTSTMASAATLENNDIVATYNKTTSDFSLGLDMHFFLGKITSNGFGYPVTFKGMSSLLGYEYRKITNLPTNEQVLAAYNEILATTSNRTYDEIIDLVNKKVHPGRFRYTNYGTELLICPKIGTGILIPFSRDINNSGFFDAGISFPFLLNVGLIFKF